MKSFTWKDAKILSFVLLIVILFSISINLVSNRLRNNVMEYGENKALEMANLVVNNAVLEIIGSRNQVLIVTSKDKNGKIESFSYNTTLLNKIASETNSLINQNIKIIQEGKIESLNMIKDIFDYKVKNDAIYYQLPLFVGSSNFLLSSLGPKVPIRFSFIGNTQTDIVSSINSYGINNIIVELKVEVKVNIKVFIPFDKKVSSLSSSFIIGSLAVQGDIPDYYIGNADINSFTGKIPVS